MIELLIRKNHAGMKTAPASENDKPNGSTAVSGTPETPAFCGTADALRALAFHKTFPEYSETPLASLPALAAELDVGGIYVKDESSRFGLNAFKVLGGSFAIGNYIAGLCGRDIADFSCEDMTNPETLERLGQVCFVTATDGNHGRGVAWTAARLGQKCVVYMPKGTAQERLDNILALGADASVTDLSYDDCVRKAAADAGEKGWIRIQDTSSADYTDIPADIMRGYTTMALEAVRQLGNIRPTHVFLQAGVGSMAGAAAAFLADYYKDSKPLITVVEPLSADCVYRTASADDGKLHATTEEMNTEMAGLSCGEVCPLAWDILKDQAECFARISDDVTETGMRTLAHPLGKDPLIVSGESGAAGIGTAIEILSDPSLTTVREAMGLNRDSVILCFSTEGDTDKENYRRITQTVVSRT